MADLIAKVARKQEPMPSIRTTRSRREILSSPLRSFMRSANQEQPLPPVRTAVPLSVWTSYPSEQVDEASAEFGKTSAQGWRVTISEQPSGSNSPTDAHEAMEIAHVRPTTSGSDHHGV